MHARPILVPFLVAGLLLPEGAGAQECELQYRTRGDTQPHRLTLDAGELRPLNANFMTEALNLGGNDLLIEIAIGGSRTEHRLIDVDGATVVLPPAAFTAVQLVDVLCTSHASYADAQAYMETLEGYGASASAIYEEALADAIAAADEARDDALGGFDTLLVQQWVESNLGVVAEVEGRWKELQGIAPGAPARKLTLEGDFPLLADAIGATVAYTGGLPAEIEAAQNRFADMSQDLQAFEDEHLGSGGQPEPFEFDPQQQFPELWALSNWSCTVDGAPVASLQAELTDGRRTLQQLDQKYRFSDRSAPSASLPRAFQNAMDFAESRSWCDRVMAAMVDAAEADFAAYEAWKGALERVKRDARSPSAYLGARATEQLDRLDRALRVAHRNREASCGRSEQVRGRAQGARRVLAGESATLEERTRAKRTIDQARRLGQQCRQASSQYESARGRVHVHVTGAVARANRQRLTTRDERSLARAYASYPEASFDAALVEAAESCTTRLHQLLDQGLAALESLPEPLPPAVAARLRELQAANERAFRATTPAASTIRSVISSYDGARAQTRDVGPTSSTAVQVGGREVRMNDAQGINEAQLDPWGEFELHFEQELAALEAHPRTMDNASSKLASELRAADRSLGLLVRAGNALGASVRAERGGVGRDVQGLVARVAGILGLQASAGESASQARACASGLGTSLADAQQSLGSRIEAYAEVVEASAASGAPANVRTAYDELEAHHETLGQILANVRERVGVFFDHLQELAVEVYRPREPLNRMFATTQIFGTDVGFPDVCLTPTPAGPVPIPYPNIGFLPYPPELDQAKTAVQTSMTGFADAFGKLGAAQVQYDEALRVLVDNLGDWGDGGAQEAFDLDGSGIEADVLDGASSELAALGSAWVEAADRTPDQVAAVVPVAMAYTIDDASDEIKAALAQARSAQNELQTCFAEGSEAIRSLTDPELITSVAENAAAGLEAEAQSVLSSLESFLSPSTGIFDDLEVTLDAASSLVGRLQSIGDEARQAYANATSPLQSQADDARQCAAGSHFQLTEQVNQIGTMLDDLEATIETLEALEAAG